MDKPWLFSSFSKGISVFVLSGEKAPGEPKLFLNTHILLPKAERCSFPHVGRFSEEEQGLADSLLA